MATTERLLSDKDAEYVLDFFGDRGVWFPGVDGDIMSGSIKDMLSCFDFIAMKDHLIFWRLRKGASKRIHDPMGALDDSEMKTDEVGIIPTHYPPEDIDKNDENNGEVDVIEQWATIPQSLYLETQHRPDLRKFLSNYINNRSRATSPG